MDVPGYSRGPNLFTMLTAWYIHAPFLSGRKETASEEAVQ